MKYNDHKNYYNLQSDPDINTLPTTLGQRLVIQKTLEEKQLVFLEGESMSRELHLKIVNL
jgi:hypothetical protein